MLTTVEAEIDIDGSVMLLEPLRLKTKRRALVTVLEENRERESEGNAQKVLRFLRTHRLPEESRPTAEEVEAQIEEARNSWD
ncbi:MAG: hypothetical protein ACRD6X_20775 [Pyrinomonadaceae bacterium]